MDAVELVIILAPNPDHDITLHDDPHAMCAIHTNQRRWWLSIPLETQSIHRWLIVPSLRNLRVPEVLLRLYLDLLDRRGRKKSGVVILGSEVPKVL